MRRATTPARWIGALVLVFAVGVAGVAWAGVPIGKIRKAAKAHDWPTVVDLGRQALRSPGEATLLAEIRELVDEASYRIARETDSPDGYHSYHTDFSRGRYRDDTFERECAMRLPAAEEDGRDEALFTWLEECRDTAHGRRIARILAQRERRRLSGLDSDGDGFNDADDACPHRAESFNSWEDHDGCPDRLPDDLQSLLGIQDAVRFPVASAELPDESREALRGLADALRQYAVVHVEVRGHASAEGAADKNKALSQARAEAIAGALVTHGVEKARVNAMGFGAEQPRGDNATEEGRRLNRRVEIHPWVAEEQD